MIWKFRSGAPWRDLPERFGDWKNTHRRLSLDALGNPLALSLPGGNAHDITQVEPLAAQVEHEALLGDKGGYDADSLITSLEVRAIKAVIPPRSTRKVQRACDFALYAERNLVERFFNTIEHYRGIATRYEKTARNFLAGLHFGLRSRLAQMTTGGGIFRSMLINAHNSLHSMQVSLLASSRSGNRASGPIASEMAVKNTENS